MNNGKSLWSSMRTNTIPFFVALLWLSRLLLCSDNLKDASKIAPKDASLRILEQEVRSAAFQNRVNRTMGCNWKSKHQTTHRLLLLVILVLSGDIQLNPGPPNWKYPCGLCSKPVKCNQPGIECEVCYTWQHCKCLDMNESEYSRLQHSDEGWCCPQCFKTAFPYHNSSTLNSNTNCSYSAPCPLLLLMNCRKFKHKA